MEVHIERLTRTTKQDYHELAKLLLQLSDRAHFTEEECKQIVEDPNIKAFVVRENKQIIGVGILAVMHIFTERRGRIEDVVIDESYRGKGLGKQLMDYLIIAARGKGLDAIELSSGVHREVANALYKKMGFIQKETNVYRIEL